ncbi:acid sphingomyelinase-like phosphodiesterase 3b [Pollicipes pollicipes]|uniref:acid sphingomyelinase-like phosphodiesterase 3b n=1 Tax=Pollicipes pollicipes TaxID=41117 RepID=UPI00188584DF|nr:acid sphingomyelinase-like phosphodiesterase 3b [Pollicipes pollicipes]
MGRSCPAALLVPVLSLLVLVLAGSGAAHPPMPAESAGGQFWQITDIHWDQTYNTSGDASDWCHGSGRADTDNGAFGNYSCDAPWPLVKEAVRRMAAVQPQPTFIIWTGDNAPHWDSGPDFKYIFSVVDNITRLMEESFPGVPIIPCLGNHDSFPPNQFPGGDKAFYTRYLSEGGWSRLLSTDEQRTFGLAGYFARRISDRLVVISLNTNIYYQPNKAISAKEPDPGHQLAWLRGQLKSARTDGYQVIVGAHIAPGYFERNTQTPFMYGNYNDALISLLNEFYEVILAQVYGHEHTDSFRVLGQVDSGGLQLRSAMFLAPSVTPWVPAAGTNPGVRLYTYSASTLTDYSQHVLNLTASNAAGRAQWLRLYDAADTYGLSDLSAASMGDLYQRLLADPALFDTYYRLNTAGYSVTPCDLACKRSQLCAIGHLREDDMAVCLNSVETMNAIASGRMLTHGAAAAAGAVPARPAAGRPLRSALIGLVVSLLVLGLLVAFAVVVVRMRKRPSAPATMLRNVASFVSVGSQGYETMT